MMPWQLVLCIAFLPQALAMCDHFLLPPRLPPGIYKHARPTRPFYEVYDARIREMHTRATAFEQSNAGKHDENWDDDVVDENSRDDDDDENLSDKMADDASDSACKRSREIARRTPESEVAHE